MALAQQRPLGERLLDAIFPEHVLTGVDHGNDRLGGKGLGDGDKGHLLRAPAGGGAGLRDLAAHRCKTGRRIEEKGIRAHRRRSVTSRGERGNRATYEGRLANPAMSTYLFVLTKIPRRRLRVLPGDGPIPLSAPAG